MSGGPRIYTKTGDKGSSSLYNGRRLPKSDGVFRALGDVDELNAHLGVAALRCEANGLAPRLRGVQSRLMDLGAHVATPLGDERTEEARSKRTAFPEEEVARLEAWIDELEGELEPLRNFILPGGGEAAAQLHVCRAVCRRAERSVVPLVQAGDTCPGAGRFLNRLSDFLFVAARAATKRDGGEEVVWTK